MGNISQIMGGDFTPTKNEVKIVDSPEVQLHNEMLNHCLTPPDHIIMDGKLRRFTSGTKGQGGHGDKTGWYVCFPGDMPAGKFGDWRSGIEVNFRADIGRKFTMQEEMANSRRMAEAKALRDAELERSHSLAANTVQTIWDNAIHATSEHGYLSRKGIQANGARVTGDGRLIVPLYDKNNELSSLQYIATDGDKKYHPGGMTLECFNALGTEANKSTIYVAEGFATSASIFEDTNQLTYIAYSASNIPNVVKYIREVYGASQDVCVVADNDESGVGQKYADQASAKYNCRVVIPPEKGDANDYKMAGYDLLALLNPSNNGLTLLNADEMANSALAPNYIINNILEDDSHGFIVAQSQTFKTFMALHFCHSICTGQSFFGFDVYKKGKVVYVCGEGKGALARRLKGIKLKHGSFDNNLFVLQQRIGIDDIPEMRELSKLIELHQPVLVIFDTFASLVKETDENSNKEVGVAINLIRKTCSDHGASSMAIHHTGKVGTSARGAYSFIANGDFLFNMTRDEGSMNVALTCVKMKDGDNFSDVHVTAEIINIGLERQDGTETTTLVLSLNDSPQEVKPKQDSLLNECIKLFERGWIFNNMEYRGETPFLSNSGMKNFLTLEMNYSEKSATNEMRQDNKNSFIFTLKNSEKIKEDSYGYTLIDAILASAFKLANSK